MLTLGDSKCQQRSVPFADAFDPIITEHGSYYLDILCQVGKKMVCQDILLESLKKSAAYQCNLLYPHRSQNSFLSGFETKPPDYFSQGLTLYERQI